MKYSFNSAVLRYAKLSAAKLGNVKRRSFDSYSAATPSPLYLQPSSKTRLPRISKIWLNAAVSHPEASLNICSARRNFGSNLLTPLTKQKEVDRLEETTSDEVADTFSTDVLSDEQPSGVTTKILSSSAEKPINVHAVDIEADAISQFNDCVSKDFVLSAALMPDVHSGYVAPIGSVIKTRGAVVPAWVGYDIGCGMIAVKMSEKLEHQRIIKEKGKELFDQVNKDIPMGAGRHNDDTHTVYLVDEMQSELAKLEAATKMEKLFEEVSKKSRPNLGTLGSGNHFIEILVHEDETWLVIHSGSRGVGHHIGTHFMKLVSGKTKGFEDTFAIEDEEMKREYMAFQKYCLAYALLNRLSMAQKVEKATQKITGVEYSTDECLWTNKNHNHCIELESNVFLHRKGATSSHKGEFGVIPANMKDGCFLVEGLGNEAFLHSSSHGAGRVMSRSRAQKKIKLADFKATMAGIIAPVTQKTIDESPSVYKNIGDVMDLQKESIKILKHLKPIINWKGF